MVEVFVLEFKKEKREHGPSPLPWYTYTIPKGDQKEEEKSACWKDEERVENSESLGS